MMSNEIPNRREFLRRSLATAGAVTLGAALPTPSLAASDHCDILLNPCDVPEETRFFFQIVSGKGVGQVFEATPKGNGSYSCRLPVIDPYDPPWIMKFERSSDHRPDPGSGMGTAWGSTGSEEDS